MAQPVGTARSTERNTGVRSLLLRAPVYQAAQKLIGSDRCSRRLASEVIRSDGETTVVDIGCGTADIADYIDFAHYHGFDPNPPYIEAASARLMPGRGDSVSLFTASLGDPDLDERLPARADIVVMMGVLHHLDDALAEQAVELAARLVGDRGRFVAFDPGFVPGQPKIAHELIKRDRGTSVRTVEATKTMVGRHFASVSVEVHHDFLRVPYTHLVVEATTPR